MKREEFKKKVLSDTHWPEANMLWSPIQGSRISKQIAFPAAGDRKEQEEGQTPRYRFASGQQN